LSGIGKLYTRKAKFERSWQVLRVSHNLTLCLSGYTLAGKMEKEAAVKSAYELADEATRIDRDYKAKIMPLELKFFEDRVPADLLETFGSFSQKLSGKISPVNDGLEPPTVDKKLYFLWPGKGEGQFSSYHESSSGQPFSVVAHCQMKEIIKLQLHDPSIESSIGFVLVYKTNIIDGLNFGLIFKPEGGLKFFLSDRKMSTYKEVITNDDIKKTLDDYVETLESYRPRQKRYAEQKLDLGDLKIPHFVYAEIRGIDPQCRYPAPVSVRTPMDRSDGGLT